MTVRSRILALMSAALLVPGVGLARTGPNPEGRALPDIRLEYARLLAQTGARDEARRQLARVLSTPLSVGETQRRARAMMQALEHPSSP